jgi:hypothetical protein
MTSTTSSAVHDRPTRIASASRELINDVAQLDPAPVGGLIELEVDRPYLIRSARPQALFGSSGQPTTLACLDGPTQATPRARYGVSACGSVSIPPAAGSDERSSTPNVDAHPRSPEADAPAAHPPGVAPAQACAASSDAAPRHGTHGAVKPRNASAADRRRGVCVPGSKVSLRQLLEHVDVQRLLSHELLNRWFSTSRLFNRLASSAFIPPYCARHRLNVDSVISRCRTTSTKSCPSLSSLSPSRIFLTACSGVCLRHFMIVPIPSSHQRDMTNTQSAWLTSQRPRHTRCC